MTCPHCQTGNPDSTVACVQCHTPLPVPYTAAETQAIDEGAPSRDDDDNVVDLTGQVLAGRYEIQARLGIGGMGAVYKARDRELDRLVALKVIRPELANRTSVMQRFKQELLLARQVTHRNVVRIFDLGITEETKFITMEHIEGRDLATMLREQGRLRSREAAEIAVQIGKALEAAHSEGVVHRDMKPHNVMMDRRGRVAVMDFGIAGSVEPSGLTQVGSILGTPEYMSPEQAKGEKADARSDLFSAGLILYELLTARLPFAANTAIGTLLKRIQGQADPPTAIEADIPEDLSAIVMKCLATDPGQRYQTAGQLVEDLERFLGRSRTPVGKILLGAAETMAMDSDSASATLESPSARLPARRSAPWKIPAAMAGLIAVLAGAGYVTRNRYFAAGTASVSKNVTLLIADFDNRTQESVFDGAVESTLGLSLESASFVNLYDRGRAKRLAEQMRPQDTTLNSTGARLVAVREGISLVLEGSLEKKGDRYSVSVRVVDPQSGTEISKVGGTPSRKSELLNEVGRLARPLRKALGDSSPDSIQMAAAETYTTSNLEAAHSYALGQEFRFAGKAQQAIPEYQKAIQLDPGFGSAYSSLAAVYANQGQREQALSSYRQAMQHINRMSERERYRTRGGYYLVTMESGKAIEEFNALVKQFPVDATGRSNLAFAYYLRRDMQKALEEGKRALEVYPRNIPYRNNVALYALYAGDFESAARESAAVITENPRYMKGHFAQAAAQLTLGNFEKARQTYEQMKTISELGASFAAAGIADLALYTGHAQDALAVLMPAIEADIKADNAEAAAKKWAIVGEAQMMTRNRSAASEALQKALSGTNEDGVKMAAARLLVELGQDGKAASIAADLSRKLGAAPRAFAKIVEGEIHLKRGQARRAVETLQEGQQLLDTWIGMFVLARAYIELGAFPEADSELDKCLKRRGEATDVMMNEMPTFRYYAPIAYFQGRVHEGLKSPATADFFQSYVKLRSAATQDPLLEDAKKRLSAK